MSQAVVRQTSCFILKSTSHGHTKRFEAAWKKASLKGLYKK